MCVVAFQILATFLGAHQSAYQTETEKSQGHAGDKLDDDAVRPEIDILQEAVVGPGQFARAKNVERMIFLFVQ